jgi:TonB-dependent receptor
MKHLGILIAVISTLVCAPPAATAQEGNGILEGRVLDAVSGDPLPGARIVVDGLPLAGSSDRDGRFRLTSVLEGDRTVTVSYLGRQEAQVPAVVSPDRVTSVTVRLKTTGFEDHVTVTANVIRDADARALNQQKTSPNISNVVSADQIGKFPDQNAAETTARIPGISITRDQGEGRYVLIRGTEPRLNSMMIDGERIPSPDPLLRQAAVDVIPSDLLQSIEVSKALTPDMDADAIGGSVNLVMKQAPDAFRLFGTIGGGFNKLLSSYDQNNLSLTAGERFHGGSTGVIASVSGSTTNRANNDVEVSYTDARTLASLNPRYYQVNRRRAGATGAIDFRTATEAKYTVRGVFNRFIDDHENRQRINYNVASSRIDRELRDRTHIERVMSLSFTGDQPLRGGAMMDFHLVGGYSDQTDPLTMTTVFRQSKIVFAPNVSATSIDPDNVQANPTNEDPNGYVFNSQLRATNFSKDRDATGAWNVSIPMRAPAGLTALFKAGVKYRDKQKGRDRLEMTDTTSNTLRLTDFQTGDPGLPSFLDGRYDFFPFTDQSKVERIPTLPSAGTVTATQNHTRDAENFDGSERVVAIYAMNDLYIGQKLYLLPGVRYEHTAADFTGRQVLFSPNGAYLATTPLVAKSHSGVVLPDVHMKYAVSPESIVRAAFTRSLARPNYYDLVPYRLQDDLAQTIALGNQDLRPTTSWNVDVMAEHYFTSVGVVSAGAFYKRLTDYIYVYTRQQTLDGALFQVTQSLNGDAATVRGLELAFQRQLPKPFSGIGVYGNYTYSGSTAFFPSHPGKASLPGQAAKVGNIAVSFERHGFASRLSVNFNGSFTDQVGAASGLDRIYDKHTQIDLSLSHKLSKNLAAYVDGVNLNNALLRYYQGTTDRVLQEEHYRWWLNFGLKVSY